MTYKCSNVYKYKKMQLASWKIWRYDLNRFMCSAHGRNDMLAFTDYSNFKMLNPDWFSNIIIFQLAGSIAGFIPYEAM
jgi:hypothetical protein